MIRIAVILAGGKSSRMGFDKATALFRGVRLIDHVAQRLRRQADRLFVSGPSAYGLDVEHVPDAPDGPPGPAAGVFSMARRLSGEEGAVGFVTAPVDGPFLPEDLVARLSGPGCAVAAAGGNVHPTFASWTIGTLQEIARTFAADGSPSLVRLAAFSDARRVVWEDASVFENFNRLSDLERFAGPEER